MRRRMNLNPWEWVKAIGRPNAPDPVRGTTGGLFSVLPMQTPGAYDPKMAAANSVVDACVQWLAAEIESIPVVMQPISGVGENIDSHPFLDILDCPNSEDTWSSMLDDIIRAAYVAGQVPLEILSGDSGGPAGFQYVTWDGLRRLPNRWLTADRREIPEEDLRRLIWRRSEARAPESPLTAVNRFIQLDNATADSAYGRMRSPYIGAIITQGPDAPPLTPSQREALRKEMLDFGGINSGQTSVANVSGMNVTELRGPAQDIAYNNVHAVCEERICALFRIPPSVVQMGTGLEQTQVGATAEQELRMAYRNGIQPLLRRLGRWLSLELLPVFDDSGRYQVAFDTSGVSFLAEEERADRHSRIRDDIDAGILTREQGFQLDGYEFEGLEFEAEEPEPEPAPMIAQVRPGQESEDSE